MWWHGFTLFEALSATYTQEHLKSGLPITIYTLPPIGDLRAGRKMTQWVGLASLEMESLLVLEFSMLLALALLVLHLLPLRTSIDHLKSSLLPYNHTCVENLGIDNGKKMKVFGEIIQPYVLTASEFPLHASLFQCLTSNYRRHFSSCLKPTPSLWLISSAFSSLRISFISGVLSAPKHTAPCRLNLFFQC